MRDFGWQKSPPVPLRLMASAEDDGLCYQVELWDLLRRRIERVLARAADGGIAQQMFETACREYPGRYVTLSHGPQRIDSNDPDDRDSG